MKTIACTCEPATPATWVACEITKRFGKHRAGVDRYDDGTEAIALGGALQDVRAVRVSVVEDPPTAPAAGGLCPLCLHAPVCVVAAAIRTMETEVTVSGCGFSVDAAALAPDIPG